MSQFMRILTILPVLAVQLAAAEPAERAISVAGEWRVRLDPDRTGATEQWFAADLRDTQPIRLPGTLDDARIGPPPAKAPSLLGVSRRHEYIGAAWYQRHIEIPAAWAGQRITLFLERCRWTVTDNHIFDIATRRSFAGTEIAGIKLHAPPTRSSPATASTTPVAVSGSTG